MAYQTSRNVTINGRRTSLRLEPSMWEALTEICDREGLNLHQVCSLIAGKRFCGTLTADVRVFVLGYFRRAATEDGHARIGHGRMAEPRFAVVG
ncbi:MAG: hypothetical protein A2516_05010 [Alphaproteobacteria bacterium RIFOXYD12_FULL_60_8]|nr:MAG: hypothetical protein A2516_05010 [Alphaproteobacteria bacterium RIFOXYD12_FULL_60_8]